MNFFNIDLHVAVIEDLKCIFKDLGHNIDSCCLSNHTWVFGRHKQSNSVIGQSNWFNLNPSLCDMFYNNYKNELSHYDGFVVTYAPCFSALYEKFNKPIILQVPIRYDVPFSQNPALFSWFNDFLKRGIDSGQVILTANSLYDSKFCEFFLERECKYISNICDYNGAYPKWAGRKNEFLLFNDSDVNIVGPKIKNRHHIKPYVWEDIESYRAIVHIPYNISTMSIYEQYSANTPLIFPSKDFLIRLFSENKNVLCGLTWNQTLNLPPSCGQNPNNYDNFDFLKNWLPLAEYYTQESMPHLIYFDSLDHLNCIINDNVIDFGQVSEKIKNFNVSRKIKIYSQWKNILDNL